MEGFVANFGLWLAYILVILGVVLAIVFPIISSISQPKTMVKSAIGVAGLLVVFVIGYLLSGSELTSKYIESGVDTEGLSKAIGGVLSMVYILMAIAAAGVVYTELNKAIK